MDLNNDTFFNIDTKLETFLAQQRFNGEKYWTELFSLLDSHANLPSIILSKVLACALSINDNLHAKRLVENQMYRLPEVLKACEILDSRRKIAELTRKIDKITKQGAKGSKIGKLKTKLDYSTKLNETNTFSLTKSKINFIKKHWVRKISKENLEFYALSYELGYWKQLADLIHVKPDDFQLSWFMNYVYGNPAPDDSIVSSCKKLTTKTAFDILSKYKPSYNYIRRLGLTLDDPTKELIVDYTDIAQIIWWLDELRTPKVDQMIINRLVESDYKVDMPYGVLVDKLFSVKNSYAYNPLTGLMGNPLLYQHLLKLAEIKLKSYKVTLEQPIVVFGDASGSMEVAIKTSSIIMSILCAICSAKMHLFRNEDQVIENPPRTASDVVLFNEHCKAHSATSPASSLYPYWSTKTIVKTFIIVTDEEENTAYSGMMFADIFEKYISSVYPAKLIFISLLRQATDNQMVRSLQEKLPGTMASELITQFIFDRNKPDLTKLDGVLARISSKVQDSEKKVVYI
jgi:hypothetical protein